MEVAGRAVPPPQGDERSVLTGWLDWQRLTVLEKCRGLDDAGARRVLVPTSPRLTISGIVAHLTRIEHDWFVHAFAGGPALPGDDWAAPSATIDELGDAYARQCERSRRITAAHELDRLEVLAPAGVELVSLRWILAHLVEETARHAGHLDLLREQLDGARGY